MNKVFKIEEHLPSSFSRMELDRMQKKLMKLQTPAERKKARNDGWYLS